MEISYQNEADVGSLASSLIETKILVNSTISDAHKGAPFLSCDLNEFFLVSPMVQPEYTQLTIKHFLEDMTIIQPL